MKRCTTEAHCESIDVMMFSRIKSRAQIYLEDCGGNLQDIRFLGVKASFLGRLVRGDKCPMITQGLGDNEGGANEEGHGQEFRL